MLPVRTDAGPCPRPTIEGPAAPSTACLELMAEPGASARCASRPSCYVVNSLGRDYLVATEIFDRLVDLRLVEQHSDREWTITPAGQARCAGRCRDQIGRAPSR